MVYGYYFVGTRTDKKEEFHKYLLQENAEKIFYDIELDYLGVKRNWNNLLLRIGKHDTINVVDLASISLNTKETLKILADWVDQGINYKILK